MVKLIVTADVTPHEINEVEQLLLALKIIVERIFDGRLIDAKMEED